MESQFNLGTDYNGTTIQVEFVLDTFDSMDNCDLFFRPGVLG